MYTVYKDYIRVRKTPLRSNTWVIDYMTRDNGFRFIGNKGGIEVFDPNTFFQNSCFNSERNAISVAKDYMKKHGIKLRKKQIKIYENDPAREVVFCFN